MSEQAHTIDRTASILELVDDVMLRHGVSFVPVLSGGTLVGYADTAGARSVARDGWASLHVSQIMVPVAADNTVTSDTPLNEVFKRMATSSRRKLMVVEGRRLVGVISLSDLMHHLALEQEIGTKLKADS